MKSTIIVAAVSMLLLAVAGSASATSATEDLPFTLDNSQISSFLGHDVWQSGKINFPVVPLSLTGNDTLQLNLEFNDNKALKLTSGHGILGDYQSLNFFIGGSQNVDTIWNFWKLNPLPYTWEFTDVSGDLGTNPITGRGVMEFDGDAMIAPLTLPRFIDLTDTSFQFRDVTLTVTVPTGLKYAWTPTFAKFSVDSKDVEIVNCPPIPEPLTMSMLAISVASVGGYIRRRMAR